MAFRILGVSGSLIAELSRNFLEGRNPAVETGSIALTWAPIETKSGPKDGSISPRAKLKIPPVDHRSRAEFGSLHDLGSGSGES